MLPFKAQLHEALFFYGWACGLLVYSNPHAYQTASSHMEYMEAYLKQKAANESFHWGNSLGTKPRAWGCLSFHTRCVVQPSPCLRLWLLHTPWQLLNQSILFLVPAPKRSAINQVISYLKPLVASKSPISQAFPQSGSFPTWTASSTFCCSTKWACPQAGSPLFWGFIDTGSPLWSENSVEVWGLLCGWLL